MPGSSTWAESRAAWMPATRTPRIADPLGLLLVAAQEGLLTADAAQHPQPGDGVGAERGQPARLLALQGLPALQRPHDEGRLASMTGPPSSTSQPSGGEAASRIAPTTT